VQLAEQSNQQSTRRGLVLIVDDEESICKSIAQVLEDDGFTTVAASNGQDALALIKQLRPDAVLLDIWMPGWDGITTLERIKEFSPETEVVMISGHATISNALEATKRGALDFIEKPVDIDSLLFAARRACQLRQAASAENRPAAERTAHHFGHPGAFTHQLAGANLGQRTLKQAAILYGQCLHSGQKSGLVLEPLPKDSGIHFGRIGDSQTVPAFVDYVGATGFATTVRSGFTSAATIEHLMSALHAYGVSNLLIKCNGEIPIFDGSAQQFVNTIEEIGLEEQGGEWYEIAPREKIVYRNQTNVDSTTHVEEPALRVEEIVIEPSDKLEIFYELDYPAPVGIQKYRYCHSGPESYKNEISRCRTFGFMRDIERLQKAGLAAGGRLDNFILIGSEGVLNTELRYPEELVRHKILDAIGDLFLIGRPLRAKVTARMTGHSDNVKVLAKLRTLLPAAA
jgi:UDP-3-O-[3-hydroxymyristoyl] N-acetylglucosamine deacetylase